VSWYNRKSEHDRDTHNYLGQKSPRYIDWEVITLFYSALHLINTFLERRMLPIPITYKDRESVVKRYLPGIHESYDILFTLSKQARYDAPIIPSELALAVECYNEIHGSIRDLL